ncbi:MAG: hypothetical protein ABI238_02920, partial [Terrimesophilobacter sp.]
MEFLSHARHARRVIALGLLILLVLTTAPSAAASAHNAGVGAGGSPDWAWPVDRPHPVVRPFTAPVTLYSSGHRGIDIAAADGTPVRAPASG